MPPSTSTSMRKALQCQPEMRPMPLCEEPTGGFSSVPVAADAHTEPHSTTTAATLRNIRPSLGKKFCSTAPINDADRYCLIITPLALAVIPHHLLRSRR